MCTSTPVVSSVHQQLYDEIYRQVVNDQVDPICRFQKDYRLTFVNQPYAALYGKRPEELIGQNMMEVIPAEYHQQVIQHLSLLSTQHTTAVDENPAYLADGSLHWFQWANRLIEHADGTIEYQGVGRDITARKQAEDAEREQRLFAEAMRDSLAALTSSLDIAQVMTQILASAAAVMPNDASRIVLLEGGSGRTAYTHGFSPEAVALLKEYTVAVIYPADGRILDGQQPYFLADVHADPNWTPPPPLAWIRSSVGVPITVNDATIGMLIANSAIPNLYGPQAITKLHTFAHYAGLALSNACHAARLEQRVAERTAELQAAKQEVEAILNHSSDAILLVQPDLSIIQCNAVTGTLLQSQVSSCQGQSLLGFIHPVSQEAVKDGAALTLHEGCNSLLQVRACRKDGTDFDAELSISPVDKRSLVCTLRDVTERVKSERQLRFYASLQESVNDAVIAVDLEYRIQSWNKAAEAIFGWRASEVIGQTTLNILRTLYSDTEDREVLRQSLFEKGNWQGEAIQHRKDGTPRNIAASITLLRDAQQVPFGMVAISRDITEQKQTAEALRRQRNFLQTVIDQIPGIVTVKNRQGKFQLANQFTAQRLHTTPAALVGKTGDDVNPNREEVDLIHQRAEKVLAFQQAIFVPEELVGGHYYQVNVIPLPGDTAEDDQVLIVGSDITERKQAEIALQQALQRERELNELKSGFLTTTSHEFRTPLTIILSTTETLRAYRYKLNDAQIEQRLDRIASQVQHLKALMEDVFDLSRMQARRVKFAPMQRNPAVLCLTLVNEFQDHTETMRHLRYTYDEGLPLADLDEHLLRQILNNLLSNAIKYSPADKLIAIHMAGVDDALVLTVRDEGIGIPMADLKHLFLPFYRATNVGTIPGTGLGLSIAKEAVDLHGGFITVESQVGVGTSFKVTLPITTGQNSEDIGGV